MTMPDGSFSARDLSSEPDDDGDESRRSVPRLAIAFWLAVIVTALPQIVTSPPLSWWGWTLLIIVYAIGGILGIPAIDDAVTRLLDQIGVHRNRPDFRTKLRAPLLWLLVVVLAFPLGTGVAMFVGWARYVTGDCPIPVPARVLTNPTTQGIVRELAESFQTSTTDSRGCLRYSVFVTSLEPGSANSALSNGWKDDEDPKKSDVARFGPRPDAYLPDSLLTLTQLGDSGSRLIRRAQVYAHVPLVLALSPEASDLVREEDLTNMSFVEQVAVLRGEGIPLVVPSPKLSQAGVVARGLYRLENGSTDKELEKEILQDARDAGYPDGGEDSLLTRFFERYPTKRKKQQKVALVLSAPFAKRPELLLGNGQLPAQQLTVVPVPSSAQPEISLPFVTLSFEDDSENGGSLSVEDAPSGCGRANRPSSCSAQQFANWLDTREGRSQIRSMDLTPCTGQACTTDPQPGSSAGKTISEESRKVVKAHDDAVRPRRIVMVMDASGSMGGRFQGVAQAVGEDLAAQLSEKDTLEPRIVGGQPASGKPSDIPHGYGQNAHELTDLPSMLTKWTAKGGSPMQEPLKDAIKTLSKDDQVGSTPTREKILLLVTDGSFTRHLPQPKPSLRELAELAEDAGVRVLVLVTGSDDCPEEVRQFTEASSGACSAVQGTVTTELVELLGGQS